MVNYYWVISSIICALWSANIITKKGRNPIIGLLLGGLFLLLGVIMCRLISDKKVL
jgi:hypothetical protein